MTSVIRVGMVGAMGKMGRAICSAIFDDPELDLVAAIDRLNVGAPVGGGVDVRVSDSLDSLLEAHAEVAVDFTHPEAVMANARWYLDHELHSVIGTTGIPPAGVEELRARATVGPANMFVSDAFSITDVVTRHIAKIAARYIPNVEMIETHPPTKADAPSGTTMQTARELARLGASSPTAMSSELVSGARGGEIDGIRVHSLRLWGGPGYEEVRFSLPGETLSIIQTPYTREPYANGTLRAVKAVTSRRGFTYGLGALLGIED